MVSDRRAALDEATEIRPAMRELVRQEFGKGKAMPVACFPEDNAAVADTRRLTAVAVARGKAGSIVMMLARRMTVSA